jgi:hypothetical protein
MEYHTSYCLFTYQTYICIGNSVSNRADVTNPFAGVTERG